MYFGPPKDAKGARARRQARVVSTASHSKAPPKYDPSKRKHNIEKQLSPSELARRNRARNGGVSSHLTRLTGPGAREPPPKFNALKRNKQSVKRTSKRNEVVNAHEAGPPAPPKRRSKAPRPPDGSPPDNTQKTGPRRVVHAARRPSDTEDPTAVASGGGAVGSYRHRQSPQQGPGGTAAGDPEMLASQRAHQYHLHSGLADQPQAHGHGHGYGGHPAAVGVGVPRPSPPHHHHHHHSSVFGGHTHQATVPLGQMLPGTEDIVRHSVAGHAHSTVAPGVALPTLGLHALSGRPPTGGVSGNGGRFGATPGHHAKPTVTEDPAVAWRRELEQQRDEVRRRKEAEKQRQAQEDLKYAMMEESANPWGRPGVGVGPGTASGHSPSAQHAQRQPSVPPFQTMPAYQPRSTANEAYDPVRPHGLPPIGAQQQLAGLHSLHAVGHPAMVSPTATSPVPLSPTEERTAIAIAAKRGSLGYTGVRDSTEARRFTANMQAEALKQQIEHAAMLKKEKQEAAKLAELADRERVEREMAEMAARHAEEERRADAAKQAKIDAAQKIAEATEAARQSAIEQRAASMRRHHSKAAAVEGTTPAHLRGRPSAVPPTPLPHGRVSAASPPLPALSDGRRSVGVRRSPERAAPEATANQGDPAEASPPLDNPRPQTKPRVGPRPPSGPPPTRGDRRSSRLPRLRTGGGDRARRGLRTPNDDGPRLTQSVLSGAVSHPPALDRSTHAAFADLLASQHFAPREETEEEKQEKKEQAFAHDEALVQIGKIKALLQAQSRETEMALHTDHSRFQFKRQDVAF